MNLKKTLFITLFFSITLSFSQTENKKITASQLKFIKEKYNWNTERVLIINFTQSNENCFYDNNRNLENSINWWNKFYSKIDLTNVLNIYVYSDKISATKLIDAQTKFEDYEDFIWTNFFKYNKECYGLLIINFNGEYKIERGEYSEREVEKYLKILLR
jgi:hypothetical protein